MIPYYNSFIVPGITNPVVAAVCCLILAGGLGFLFWKMKKK